MVPRPAASQIFRSPARAYLIVLAFACPALASPPPGRSESIPRTPVIDGQWWRVSHSPKLPEIDSGPGEVVDHCFFRAANGKWQLWTQIRGTKIGRLFYRWEGGAEFEEQDWTPKGICWRADRESGESWQTGDQEFVHAPHVLVEDGRFVLYYGGGPSSNAEHCQVNLATSKNGIDFTRFRDPNGASRIFIGPGWARDPMVLKVGGHYFNYYCADEKGTGVICLRTSTQATGAPWSEYEVVSQGGILGTHRSAQQCPFVIYLDGY